MNPIVNAEYKTNHKSKRYTQVKSYIHLLIILIALFGFQTNEGFACGNTSEITALECGESNQNKDCCNNHSESEGCEDCGGDCGGDCGDSSCQCTHLASIPFLNDAKLKVSHNFNAVQKFWNFDLNVPKPIYLAIWAPPKIS